METGILADGTLSSRLKGDLYRRKFRAYEQAEVSRGRAGKSKKKDTLLSLLLERYDDETVMRVPPEITGNEFKDRPPTAAGREMFVTGILTVMRTRDQYRQLLSELENDRGGNTVTLFFGKERAFDRDALSTLVKLFEEALRLFFLANGIDEHTREAVTPEVRSKGREQFRKLVLQYETTIATLREVRPLRKLVQEAVERFSADIPLEDRNRRVTTMDGYVSLWKRDVLPALQNWTSYDELRAAGKELVAYRDAHPGLYEAPAFRQVFFENRDLPAAAEQARSLRNSMAELSKTSDVSRMTEEEQRELMELWILGDAMTRASYLLLEFVECYENRSPEDFLSEAGAEIYAMRYRVQEEECRRYITELTLERKRSNVSGI